MFWNNVFHKFPTFSYVSKKSPRIILNFTKYYLYLQSYIIVEF